MILRSGAAVVCVVLLGTLVPGPAAGGAAPAEAAKAERSPFRMVSVDDRGRPADDHVYGGAVSRDGRLVAFTSGARNLDRRTRGGYPQVFLRDNRTGRVRAVGADRRGRLARSAESVDISPNGRFVAFSSPDDLVGPDVDGVGDEHADVFVRDLRTGRVRRASTAAGGGMADGESTNPVVADTGDVVFTSAATDLVAGDTNAVHDYFLFDWGTQRVRRLATAEIARASVRLSGDGAVVAVVTTEVLSGRDSGTLPDVYVLRRSGAAGGTWSMPLAQPTGLPTDTGCGWTGLSVSHTGRYLTAACADGGVASPPLADKPVHLWWVDRRTERVRLVNRTDDIASEVDAAQVSDDGRRVFFAGQEHAWSRTGTARAATPYEGVFLWERGAVRQLTRGYDAWWDSGGFGASGDGRTVAFTSSSPTMAGRDADDDVHQALYVRRVGTGSRRSATARSAAPSDDLRPPGWTLASAGADGTGADAATVHGSITRDGRTIAFSTTATNLGLGGGDAIHAYLRDRSGRVRPAAVFGRRQRVARASYFPSISPSGRFVAFCSADPRIVRPDSFTFLLESDHPDIDVFVRDLRTGVVRRASSDRRGREADDFSCAPQVADTGDVVFESKATDLAGPPEREHDSRIYHWDWSSGRVRRLTDNLAAYAISADGRTVVVAGGDVRARGDGSIGNDAYVLRRPARGEGLGEWRRYDQPSPAGARYSWCGGEVDVTGDGDWFVVTCSSGGPIIDPAGSDAGPDVRAYRFHRRTGRSVLLDPGPTGNPGAQAVSISDDGRTVALAEPIVTLDGGAADSEGADVFVWRQGAGTSLWTVGRDAHWDLSTLDLSGNGRRLIFTSDGDAMSDRDLNGELQVDLFVSTLR
jgi:Tol biopolymer transport system component